MLIVKIKRTEATRADLFGKGHKYRDMVLFDLGELLEVGLDPENLPIGVEKPCRFFAHYELSDKLNEAGNPYRDIVMLEPIENGNGTTAPPPMNDAMLAAILAELQKQTALLKVLVGTVAGPVEEPEIQAPMPDDGPEPESELEQWFAEHSDNTPTSPRQLLDVLGQEGRSGYNKVRTLHDALAAQFGDTWRGWPPASDLEGWRHLANVAMKLPDA